MFIFVSLPSLNPNVYPRKLALEKIFTSNGHVILYGCSNISFHSHVAGLQQHQEDICITS